MKEDSENKNTKKEEKDKSSRASKFLNKLDFMELAEHENSTKSSNPETKEENHSAHSFPMLSDIFGSEKIEEIKSGKSKLLLGIGVLAGLLFILLGIIIITMGSADRVADNVVFGEKEVFSVFLILLGIIIMACTFAYRYMGKLFFKGIDGAIESYGETSSSSPKNNIKGDNINRNNR
ncbi:hypothetical protein [Methanobacterium sp. ACI-7]|uniref:hypothetical protein n=1 Tax=unclassified Methanobacterium TaxID=2627676 RepID=UPI0039C34995